MRLPVCFDSGHDLSVALHHEIDFGAVIGSLEMKPRLGLRVINEAPAFEKQSVLNQTAAQSRVHGRRQSGVRARS